MVNIWIPGSAREAAPPRFECRICNDRFVDERAFESHVLKCDKAHENELHEYVEFRKEFMEMPDPEWEAFNRSLRQKGIDPMTQFRKKPKSVKRSNES
jgi:hypothetical protein